jgi:general secretion pathway protein D
VRELRLQLLMAGLSTSLAFLGGFGSDNTARADGDTNVVQPANVELKKLMTAAEETDDNASATNSPEEDTTEAAPTNAAVVPQPMPPIPAATPAAVTPPPPAPIPGLNPQARPQPALSPVRNPTPAPTAIPAPPPPPAAHDAQSADTPQIEFEFQGASINAILEWYSRLTNRSIISAPNLQITVNFRSQTKLTRKDAIEALDSVLAINNIAAIPLGDKFLKIVQITTAKTEGLPVGPNLAASDTLGTQIIPLKNAKASDVVPVLQPYMHPYGQLVALQDSNSILITETAANLKQMLEIVAYVDQPSALRMEMRSYVLFHAKAADVMQRLQTIIQEAEQAGAHAAAPGQPAQPPSPIRRPGQPAAAAVGGEGTVVEGKVIMAADERTNKIFILTRPSNFGFFDRLIAELDAKVEPDVVMKVISLNYAAAEDVASLLNGLITGGSVSTAPRRTTSSSGTTSSGARATSVPPPPVSGGSAGGSGQNSGLLQYAEGVRIIPDPRTNCLIVMATKEDMLRIEEMVQSVDTSVAQVQIEVVIAEVTLNNELDVGVDMFKRLFNYGQTTQVGGSSTSGNTPADLSSGSLATNVAAGALAPGLTWFTTFRNLKLDAVIHALATTANGKVLSTPVIQTMDNQEADITVGESVPVPTSQTSSLVSGVGTLATAGVTSSIQYEDVAIELKVTPRINPDGYVRMDIEQKVNDIGANVNIGGTIVPTILKREAKSSVAVQDQSTIVLGGLIQQQKTVSATKVPFLGDIPFFGQIFKSQTNNRQRTELIIFIRPSVLRTDKAGVLEARRRLRMLGVGEQLEERYFPNVDSGTNATSRTSPSGPVSMNPAPAAPTPTAAEDASGSQSAKIKALKLQDGDITTQ